MRRIGFGLAAALILAVLAPSTALAAKEPKAQEVPKEMRVKGMKEAPAVLQSSNLPCQLTDARYVGAVAADKKAGRPAMDFYEVACQSGVGYMLQQAKGEAATGFTCLENDRLPDGKPSPNACKLPGNANSMAVLGPMLAKSGVPCTPATARGVGRGKSVIYLEVACTDDSGYILIAPEPFDPAKKLEAQNCLAYDAAADSNVKCTLGSHEKRVAFVDTFVAAAKNGCVVKDRGFIGLASDGANYYEASCQDGKGYVYKVVGGALTQTIDCAKAQGLLGGCKLTDAREAETEQAGLYTKLAKAGGANCEVTKYAALTSGPGEDKVELACADGKGYFAAFKTGAKSQIVPCSRSPILGYKCGLNKPTDVADLLTADLRKAGLKECTVKDYRWAGISPKGTSFVEVTCTDGLKGDMIEYSTDPITSIAARSCAFEACTMPGNK